MLRITTTRRDQATRTFKLEGKLLDRLFEFDSQRS
jgi:hypothetical protein